MDTYARLMQAEALLDPVRRRRGVRDSLIGDILDAVESDVQSEDDLYLRVLVRYVAALGGRAEVRAVLPEETIELLGLPDTDHR